MTGELKNLALTSLKLRKKLPKPQVVMKLAHQPELLSAKRFLAGEDLPESAPTS